MRTLAAKLPCGALDVFIYLLLFFQIYLFYWKVRYTERKRDREEDLLLVDSFSRWPVLSQFQVRSLELLPGLSHRCRVPRLWAVLDCFSRPQAGSWMGSGAARIRTGIHMGSQCVQGEDLS